MIRLAADRETRDKARSVTEEMTLRLTLKTPGLDPVQFWDQYASHLPHLHKIASEIMWVIQTSAATERQFSTCKRVQVVRRLHMNAEVFEDAVLLSANQRIADTIFKDYQLRIEEDSLKA